MKKKKQRRALLQVRKIRGVGQKKKYKERERERVFRD